MKKLFLGMLALTTLSVVSCAKEYNCECKVTHREQASLMGQTIDASETSTQSHTLKGKEDDMKKSCEESGYVMSYNDQLGVKHTITSKCEIK